MQIFERRIAKVVDGDTFRIWTPIQGSKSVRIADFNSPKFGQDGFTEARNRLKRFEGKKIEIIPVAKSYGRTVAKIFYNEEHLTKFL